MVLKPSEISKNTEMVLVEVLPRYLDQVSRGRRAPCAGQDRVPTSRLPSVGCVATAKSPPLSALVSLRVKEKAGTMAGL